MSKMEKMQSLLRKIPKGKVTTYGALAKALSSHPRAIGKMLNCNSDSVRYPCFKVVRSDGSLGGYADGVNKKIILLKRDGIRIINRKIDLDTYGFFLNSVV